MPVLHALDQADLYNYALKYNFDFICVPNAIRKKDIQYVRDMLGP